MAELLNEFESEMFSITLVPSGGGAYEVVVNGRLIYSKLETYRHAEPGEVATMVRNILKEG